MKPSAPDPGRLLILDGAMYAVVVFAGYFLVATSWWFQDDWHFLANALDIAPRDSGLARFVSYELYWRLFIDLFGVSSVGWAATRLLIHLGNALLVRAIAGRVTNQPAAGFAAGLLFAVSPLAFECLYWASGVVDLIGTLTAFLAFQLWLRGDRRIGPAVAIATIVAVFSKETGLAVVALLALHAASGRRASPRELAFVIVLVAAAVAALAALHADMERSGDYALTIAKIPRNLAVYGYWLISPPSLMKSVAIHSPLTIAVGACVWIVWAVAGMVAHRRGNHVPAQAEIFALLVLAPAMLVGDHAVPRYVYAACPAFLVAVVSVIGGIRGLSIPRRASVAFLAAVFAWTATAYQVDARWPSGRPHHRYVAKREISTMAMRAIAQQGPRDSASVALVVSARANRDEVALLQDAIGNDLGVRVLFGAGIDVRWIAQPEDADPGAVIMLVEGMTMRPFGGSR